MAVTLLSDVSEQVQKFWAPITIDSLKQDSLLPALVNKDYQGNIMNKGDTVYVSMINRPTATRKTTSDVDADVFETEKLSTTRVGIVADQRITAAIEIEDLVDLQSQIGDSGSKIRQGLMEALEIALNTYCYSLVNPSQSAPDHLISGVTDFNLTQLAAARTLAAQAKWNKTSPWYILSDPVYFSDLLAVTNVTSQDFGATDNPVISGRFGINRFGFSVLEDNSRSTDNALAFHPDFLYLVMQKMPTFKLSDQHPNKRHGYILSVDMICGAKLGLEGNVKHIKFYNS